MKQRECVWRMQRLSPVFVAPNVHYTTFFFFFREYIFNMTWQELKGKIPRTHYCFAAYILSAIEVILLVLVTQQANRAQD